MFETLNGTNHIAQIWERDSADKQKKYELAALFKMAKTRENLQSAETLGVLFGKIQKFFADMKAYCFDEADDPFTLMTVATYIPPKLRTQGCLYGLETLVPGVIVLFFDRYITGMEYPTVEDTVYGIEREVPSAGETDEGIYKGIFNNIVYLEKGQQVELQEGMLYCMQK